MERKPRLNTGLLRRVIAHITEEPKRYDQRWWADRVEGEGTPVCKTVGCIAGWAVLLMSPRKTWEELIEKDYGNIKNPTNFSFREEGQRLLGLTGKEANVLFDCHNQRQKTGRPGIGSAVRKIEALIRDRGKFAEEIEVKY